MDKKEQTRLRVKRYRDKQKSVTQSPGSVTESPDSVTMSPDSVTQDVTQYPAIIEALVENRDMLEKVYQSLKTFNVADKVYYGYPGLGGVPFDVVGDYLDATR